MLVVAIDIGGTFTDLIGFDEAVADVRPGQEPDHAGASRAGHHRLPAQERHRGRRHRRTDPRLDHRHQHADRAQGRQDRAAWSRAAPATSTSSAAAIGPRPTISCSTSIARWCRAASRARSTSACWPPARCTSRSIAPASRTPADMLAAEGVEAVAVCFLHSYVNPEHERIAGEMIRKALPERLSVAVARHPARISRVRAHVDDGGERLYRAEGRRLCEEPEIEPRRDRLPRQSLDHALATAA